MAQIEDPRCDSSLLRNRSRLECAEVVPGPLARPRCLQFRDQYKSPDSFPSFDAKVFAHVRHGHRIDALTDFGFQFCQPGARARTMNHAAKES